MRILLRTSQFWLLFQKTSDIKMYNRYKLLIFNAMCFAVVFSSQWTWPEEDESSVNVTIFGHENVKSERISKQSKEYKLKILWDCRNVCRNSLVLISNLRRMWWVQKVYLCRNKTFWRPLDVTQLDQDLPLCRW